MSLVLASGAVNNPAIDELVQSSLESENVYLRLGWIPCEDITNVKPTQIDNVYNAVRKTYGPIMLLCLGNSEECTPALVSEFAKIYSLPTHNYNKDVNQFRRYSRWLESRNRLIKGFTKLDNNFLPLLFSIWILHLMCHIPM